MRALLLAVLLALAAAAPARRAGAPRQEAAADPRDRDRRAEPGDVLQPVLQGARRSSTCASSRPGTRCATGGRATTLDRYMHAARAAGVQRAARLRPLAQREAQGAPLRARRARVHQGVPEVQEALPVGEGVADLERGQPLRRADLPQGPPRRPLLQQHQAQLLRLHRRRGRRAGHADDAAVGARVPPHGPQRQGHLGPAQLHRRQPLPHHGHEGAAQGGAAKGKIWFTETGGLVVRRNGSRIAFPGNKKHAAKATKQVFKLAR